MDLNYPTRSESRDSPYDQVAFLALNWHRNANGVDWLDSDGLSVGQIISGSAWIAFASLYREYFNLQQQLKSDGSISIAHDDARLTKNVASKIAKKVITKAYSIRDEVHFSWPLERTLFAVPGWGRKSRLVAAIQLPILNYLRGRKNLYLSDWTLSKYGLQYQNALFLNSRNIFRGAYFQLTHSMLADAQNRFPKTLHEIVTPQKLVDTLHIKGYAWDATLVELCCDHLISNYSENRPLLMMMYALYRELLSRYSPTILTISGELYEPYTIAFQLAKHLGVVTELRHEVYNVISFYPTLLDSKGEDWLIDKFIAYGRASLDNLRTRGVDPSNCELMAPPFLDHHRRRSSKPILDVIIMTWTAMTLDPMCRTDASPDILREALGAVKSVGWQNIAIKVKSQNEIPYVGSVLKELDLSDTVPILSGMFYEHVYKTRAVVGGISSGIVEALYHDIPYYVFEPLENGYSDTMINNSSMLNRQSISRTSDELVENIRKRKVSCIASKDYVFGGENIHG